MEMETKCMYTLLLVLVGVGGGMTCSAGGDRGSNYSPSCGHLSLDQVSQSGSPPSPFYHTSHTSKVPAVQMGNTSKL